MRRFPAWIASGLSLLLMTVSSGQQRASHPTIAEGHSTNIPTSMKASLSSTWKLIMVGRRFTLSLALLASNNLMPFG
jgi:hypothetical protein